MRLSQRIAEAGLTPAAARTFAAGLREVARADGPTNDLEARLIRHLIEEVWEPEETAAPFEALWGHADLFLSACVYVAVSDGEYGVEEARVISLFAHRLGYSVRRLAALEARTFATLREQAPPPSAAILRHLAPPSQPGVVVEGGRYPAAAEEDEEVVDLLSSVPREDEDPDGDEVTEPLYRRP